MDKGYFTWILSSEVFHKERSEISGVGVGVVEAVILGQTERQVGWDEGRVSPWAEYGDDVCGKGRGEEERHDADGEAHARVVEQRHPSI